jgi:hypothetical protein
MLRIPHCLDNGLIDGGKVVSLTHPPHFTPQKHYFNVSGTHYCQRLSKSQGLERPEGLGKFKNSHHRVSNPRPSGLLHSILTTTLPRAPYTLHNIKHKYFVALLYGLYVGWCAVDVYSDVARRSFSVDQYLASEFLRCWLTEKIFTHSYSCNIVALENSGFAQLAKNFPRCY